MLTACRLSDACLTPDPCTVPCTQILYWESLRLDVPFDAIEVDAQRHRHAALRHRMAEVVRKYNQVWQTSYARCSILLCRHRPLGSYLLIAVAS